MYTEKIINTWVTQEAIAGSLPDIFQRILSVDMLYEDHVVY